MIAYRSSITFKQNKKQTNKQTKKKKKIRSILKIVYIAKTPVILLSQMSRHFFLHTSATSIKLSLLHNAQSDTFCALTRTNENTKLHSVFCFFCFILFCYKINLIV